LHRSLLEPDVFELFLKPGEVVEVRALGLVGTSPLWGRAFTRGVVAGYFDDHNAFCNAVKALDKLRHGGIYFTIQVIDPRLIGRAFNRLSVPKNLTSDQDVVSYRWLPIDLDPVRPAGISSSDVELQAAIQLRDQIAGEISSEYDLPAPINAVSGNGAHLLYPLPDLPAKKYQPAIRNMLEKISGDLSTAKVKIDSKVFNPSRIWKLYGTKTCKGDPVASGPHREARPYRPSYIDHIPMLEAS
jgi:hypothetical protein